MKINISGKGEEQNIEYEKETIPNKESKLGVSLAEKSKVQELLKNTAEVIKKTVKFKEKADKVNTAWSKVSLHIDKEINNYATANPTDKEETKNLRKVMRAMYKIIAADARLTQDIYVLNVKLARAVLGYASFNLKHYKSN